MKAQELDKDDRNHDEVEAQHLKSTLSHQAQQKESYLKSNSLTAVEEEQRNQSQFEEQQVYTQTRFFDPESLSFRPLKYPNLSFLQNQSTQQHSQMTVPPQPYLNYQ